MVVVVVVATAAVVVVVVAVAPLFCFPLLLSPLALFVSAADIVFFSFVSTLTIGETTTAGVSAGVVGTAVDEEVFSAFLLPLFLLPLPAFALDALSDGVVPLPSVGTGEVVVVTVAVVAEEGFSAFVAFCAFAPFVPSVLVALLFVPFEGDEGFSSVFVDGEPLFSRGLRESRFGKAASFEATVVVVLPFGEAGVIVDGGVVVLLTTTGVVVVFSTESDIV